jgi:hypothetical protein
MLDWDNLHLFLMVARHGRLIAAGRALGVDHTTIARRLSSLETALGARLFERSPRGVTLTVDGQILLPTPRGSSRNYALPVTDWDRRGRLCRGLSNWQRQKVSGWHWWRQPWPNSMNAIPAWTWN